MKGYDEQQYKNILHKVWGYDDFRGIQSDIIRSIANGNDTLGLMPTGGGKSLTFQVPALVEEGTCIVVTPLIALMKDQVDNLRRRGIIASAVYSGMSRSEILTALDNCILGNTKLLYVSPERLGTDLFKTKLMHMHVSFITVDEAHCISQWGYDFRPSYLCISDIRTLKPDVPILALTATATPHVVDDIQERLDFKKKNVFRMSFERKNLAYIVRQAPNKEEQLVKILKSVDGCAIVYTRSRKQTKEISQLLENNGISSTFYHAGLEPSVKDTRQKEWHDDEKRVMVATNAFGMGIDKPNVRIVIHISPPNSLEAYFQEAGRAGRDGKKAYAILLYSNNDKHKLEKRIAQEFPPKEEIVKIYDHLAYYFQIAAGFGYGHTFKFDIERFSVYFHHFPIIVNSALKILSQAGYIDYEMEPDSRARLKFILERDQLYLLRSNSPNEEQLIATILREYPGLFNDYRYIEEAFLADITGMTRQQVYMILKSLNQRHIVSYIPQSSTPLITYTRDRELPENVVIPPTVYEQRKEQFTERIRQMISYALTDCMCRSRQLLRYFGETESHDCGQCDVCLATQKDSKLHAARLADATNAILQQLDDGNRHNIKQVYALPYENDIISEALEELLMEENVLVYDDMIYIKKEKTKNEA